MIDWVEDFLSELSRALLLDLELLYLNTISVKTLMEIFDVLEAGHRDGPDVAVTWYFAHNNERVGELAEKFKEDCSFSFAVVARP